MLGESAGNQLGGHVDDGDHPVVRHARRADHADGADDLAVDFVRRGDDAALVERNEAGFAADEELHAVCAAGHVEKLQKAGLALEEIEEITEPLHV